MSDSKVATTSGGLSVQFTRNGDRHSHRILVDGEVIAASVEGGGEEEWPPSPPLQQLSIEDLGNGPVGLLVGMAGRSHWSLSVEAQDSALVFDAACRIRGEAGPLGSAYSLSPQVTVEQSEGGYTLQFAGRQLGLSVERDPTLEEAALETAPTDDVISIALNTPIRDGATARWRYRLEA